MTCAIERISKDMGGMWTIKKKVIVVFLMEAPDESLKLLEKIALRGNDRSNEKC